MLPSGSPTVHRRRLAAELRQLRGSRTGGDVARGIGWSATKISRVESGRESLPPAEIKKLIDFYGVADPRRPRLLDLAEGAVQRGWWDEYADVLTPDYLEFIGLEAGADSILQWQSDVIPGLLQTEDYARQLDAAAQRIDPTTPPTAHERFLRARAVRQERLTRDLALQLSVVLDEAVLLRCVGNDFIMRAQLVKLAETAELPNVELQILPLASNSGLVAASFAILSFGFEFPHTQPLSDVVSAESLSTEVYIEGEAETHFYRLFFQELGKAALSPAESKHLIVTIMRLTRP